MISSIKSSRKNLSIITNFGCSSNCSFCISNSQESKVDFKLDLNFRRKLILLIKLNQFKRLSISGGGEPIHINNLEVYKFFYIVLSVCSEYNIMVSIHTNLVVLPIKLSNLIKSRNVSFVVSLHPNDFNQKITLWRTRVADTSKLRFVYIIGNYVDDVSTIKKIIKIIPSDSRLTLKQLDGTIYDEIKDIRHIMSITKKYQNMIILKNGDYNTYYNLDNGKLYKKFKDIKLLN